jgi:hypothetical protein
MSPLTIFLTRLAQTAYIQGHMDVSRCCLSYQRVVIDGDKSFTASTFSIISSELTCRSRIRDYLTDISKANTASRTAKYSSFLGSQESAVFHYAKSASNDLGSVWYAPNAGGMSFSCYRLCAIQHTTRVDLQTAIADQWHRSARRLCQSKP